MRNHPAGSSPPPLRSPAGAAQAATTPETSDLLPARPLVSSEEQRGRTSVAAGMALAGIGERIFEMIENLDAVMFEASDMNPQARSDVHEAMGLLVEALEILGIAQNRLQGGDNQAVTALSLETLSCRLPM